jgi:hypothetical protein
MNMIGINSERPEPFKVGEKGPNEVAALEKLNKYETNILVKVFKTLEDKRRKELEEEVKKAIEEDKKLYQFWKNKEIQPFQYCKKTQMLI